MIIYYFSFRRKYQSKSKGLAEHFQDECELLGKTACEKKFHMSPHRIKFSKRLFVWICSFCCGKQLWHFAYLCTSSAYCTLFSTYRLKKQKKHKATVDLAMFIEFNRRVVIGCLFLWDVKKTHWCLHKYVNKLHELTCNVPPRRMPSKPYTQLDKQWKWWKTRTKRTKWILNFIRWQVETKAINWLWT